MESTSISDMGRRDYALKTPEKSAGLKQMRSAFVRTIDMQAQQIAGKLAFVKADDLKRFGNLPNEATMQGKWPYAPERWKTLK
jgi:hypothetical protein